MSVLLGLLSPCAQAGKLDSRLQAARDSVLRKNSELKALGLAAADESVVFNVFLRLAVGVDAASLRAAYPKMKVRSVAGPVATAYVPLDLLPSLESDTAIIEVSASRPQGLLMNVVRSNGMAGDAYAGVLQSGLPDLDGVDGSGVVLGFVDSGIDWTHPDFYEPDAPQASRASRIISIWDQTIAAHGQGPSPAGYGYGAEYSQSQINSKIRGGSDDIRSVDAEGHGTHVASIAAGDGSATNGNEPAGTYAGMAPGAGIIMVKSTLQNADIIDGVNYIVAKAASMGRRAVINLSIGAQSGPHDGTDAYESALGDVAASTPVVVAMGNDHAGAPHASASFGAFESKSFVLDLSQAGSWVEADFWHPGADAYTLTVTPACAGCSGSLSVASGANQSRAFGTAMIIVYNDVASGHPVGDKDILVEIDDPGLKLTSLTCQLTRTANSGSGRVDGFTDPSITGARFSTFVDNSMTLTEPGSARHVISAAAYATKSTWRAANGSYYSYSTPPTLGDIASFSGRGPSRDGRQKPDAAAPGFGVAAANSSAASPDASFVLWDGKHVIKAGTSMAAPVVSGFAALKLQVMPGAPVSEIRADIAANARTDGFVSNAGVAPNNAFGYGKLLGTPKVQQSPGDWQAAVLGTSSITFTWGAVRNAVNYHIYDKASPPVCLATRTVANMTFTTLTANTTYGYAVRAYNPIGEGPALVASAAGTLAEPVAGAVAVAPHDTYIDVTFNPCPASPQALSCEGYVLESATSPDFSGAVSSQTPNRALDHLRAQGLAPLTNYYARLGTLSRGEGINYRYLGLFQTQEANLVAPGAAPFTGVSASAVRFNWTRNDNPAGRSYRAECSPVPDFSSDVRVVSGYELYSALFDNLASNARYYFRVAALNLSGAPAAFSAAADTATWPAPAAGLANSISSFTAQSLRGAWSSAGNAAGTSFLAQVSADPGFFSGIVSSTTANSYADFTGLDANTTYYLRVRTLSSHSPNPDAAAADIGGGSTLASAPTATQNAFVSVSYTSITVRWVSLALAPQKATCEGYRLELSTAADFSGILHSSAAVPAAVDHASVGELLPATTYYARVGALNWSGAANYVSLSSACTLRPSLASGVVAPSGPLSLALTPDFPEVRALEILVPAGVLPPGTPVQASAGVEGLLENPRSNAGTLERVGWDVGWSISAGGLQPGGNIVITMYYDPAYIPPGRNPRTLMLHRFDEASNSWIVLPTFVDSSANRVMGLTNHLSFFAPFFVTPAASLDDEAQIFPIPWQPGSGNGLFDANAVTFAHLPAGAGVSIFTITGEFVWKGESAASGVLSWTGENAHGRKVGSGTYVAVISSGSRRVVRRVVVIR